MLDTRTACLNQPAVRGGYSPWERSRIYCDAYAARVMYPPKQISHFFKLKLIPRNRGPSCRAKRRASPVEHFFMPINSTSSPCRCRLETLVSLALLSFLLFGSQPALA